MHELLLLLPGHNKFALSWARWTCVGIIGCLKYGACFSEQNEQDDPVFLIRLKDEELVEAPDDSA